MVLQRMESQTPKAHLFHPTSRRLHVMLLLMVGFFCASYMRSNIGMTMTCIVNSTAVAIETAKSYEGMYSKNISQLEIPEQCQHEGIEEENGVVVNDYGGTIVWSQSMQNLLFAGTFWGSLFTIIPAGYLVDITSAKNLYLLSVINYSFCSILFPFLALYTSPWIVFGSRFVMGLGEALIVPAANKIITRWVPNHEKSTAASIFTMGNQFAGGIGIPIVAGFCASRFKWPGVYYFCGGIGVVWCIIWYFVVTNAPAKAKLMSRKERTFLNEAVEQVRNNSAKKEKIPWGKILTSLPVISCFVSIFGVNMVVVLLQSYQPTFMKEVLYLRLVDNGLYSAAPYIIQIIGKLSWSITIDHLKATGRISDTLACKISQMFATFTIGIFLILITHFADCAKPEITLFMFCAIGLGFSTAISGFYTSLLSLAPAYVGIISSLCQFVGVVGMLVPPYLVSRFRIYGTLEEWQKIFYIVAIYTMLSGVFFMIFGKGEVLPWGRGERSEKLNPGKEIEDNIQKIEITLEQ